MTSASGAASPASSSQWSANKDWLRALERTGRIEANPGRTLAAELDDIAAQNAAAPALLSEHESFSFGELAERSNRYARWAITHGLEKGDVVGLMMPNRPEFIAAWLGFHRVGVAVALLNTRLPPASLAHCIAISKANCVIADSEYFAVCESALAQTDKFSKIFIHGGEHNGPHRIDLELEDLSGKPLDLSEKRAVELSNHALYIYTSGTTGLPKAAIVTHRRLMNWGLWFCGLIDARPNDRMYNCLPLYHSVGGVVAVWAVLLGGGSVVIRERFSASSFWEDICRQECTLFQYIGELCRFLANAPSNPYEKAHRLRLCVGNGLRLDVWKRFEQRFAIPRILEFYAASESNFSLYNVEGEPGAIGRVPSFIAHRFQVAIVKYDFDRGEPWRDENGRCVRCARGGVGEAIGKIEASSEDGSANFEGYLSRIDSEKKILRNVFKTGDAWMRSGDLMRKDARGFYYFEDRVGDTFRWRGENVAASEVAEVIAACPRVAEVTVYGVEVQGYDGRAGMAAVVVAPDFDLALLKRHIDASLPDYARPRFLRITDSLETTETFKLKKNALAAQGFDPGATGDLLYCADPRRETYRHLDGDLYHSILEGTFRL
ncbi:MAG TPA: long-chain-acyl-CoA synthetase [Methylocella sp.]|nr:long-chain-acyl-CoA synthetase [Methylocella sp.]